MVKSKNTETKILDSAWEVFIQKGFEGTRMQEIADHAGINKALLHYYFRNKERLFTAVFENTIRQIGPALSAFMNEDIPLEIKVWKFVDNYLEMIKKFPQMPLFIMNEISSNPERILQNLNFEEYIDFHNLETQLQEEYEKGHIIKVDIRHFIVNIIGLTVFPFAAKIIIQKNLRIKEKDWLDFIEERKKVIPQTIMSWIKKAN